MKKITPYLTIPNRCEEALLFYQTCFGGEISFLQRYSEAVKYTVSEEYKNKIAHAEFVAQGIHFYASDGFEGDEIIVGNNIGMTISFEDKKEQHAVFDRLNVGGVVTLDFSETTTSSTLVALVDKFGIHWYLDYSH